MSYNPKTILALFSGDISGWKSAATWAAVNTQFGAIKIPPDPVWLMGFATSVIEQNQGYLSSGTLVPLVTFKLWIFSLYVLFLNFIT